MDPAQLTGLGIVVLVILAGVVILASARRNQSGRAIGMLSRETRSRDVGSRRDASQREGQPSAAGRELEVAATSHRRAVTMPVAAAPTTPDWKPPDPGTLGASS